MTWKTYFTPLIVVVCVCQRIDRIFYDLNIVCWRKHCSTCPSRARKIVSTGAIAGWRCLRIDDRWAVWWRGFFRPLEFESGCTRSISVEHNCCLIWVQSVNCNSDNVDKLYSKALYIMQLFLNKINNYIHKYIIFKRLKENRTSSFRRLRTEKCESTWCK